MEGGGIQHFQIKLKFWHYTTNKFDLKTYRHKQMKLFIDIVIKRIYLFNIVAQNYRKKIGFPVCKKENFAGLQAHRKRGKSARASPTPHHTLHVNAERSARFIAQHLSALRLSVCACSNYSQAFRAFRTFHLSGRTSKEDCPGDCPSTGLQTQEKYVSSSFRYFFVCGPRLFPRP